MDTIDPDSSGQEDPICPTPYGKGLVDVCIGRETLLNYDVNEKYSPSLHSQLSHESLVLNWNFIFGTWMIYENGIQESMENMMFFHVFPITMGFLVKFPFNQSNAKNLVVDSAIEYMMRMMGPYQLREGLLCNASYILGQRCKLWCTITQLRKMSALQMSNSMLCFASLPDICSTYTIIYIDSDFGKWVVQFLALCITFVTRPARL